MSETEDKKINIKSTIRDSNTESMSGVESVSAVHVDRAMVAVDPYSKTATVSLLTMHAIPKFSTKFDIENFTWELVGELKVPFNVMDALAIYYLSARTSKKDELYGIIKKYLTEQPVTNTDYVPYGPLS